MLEIGIEHFNEMVRYEKYMDYLRTLALWITQHENDSSREFVFGVIKDHAQRFAVEILAHGQISQESLQAFQDSMNLVNHQLGITPADVAKASQQQRNETSGFWEMRRVIGQFGDAAKEVASHRVSHIIAAGVSGCIIGEYLGLLICQKSGYQISVDHIIFTRFGREPIEGILKPGFALAGKHVLLVDDAVMETITCQVMTKKLRSLTPGVQISLLAIDIAPKVLASSYLDQFAHVYQFEE